MNPGPAALRVASKIGRWIDDGPYQWLCDAEERIEDRGLTGAVAVLVIVAWAVLYSIAWWLHDGAP